MNKTYSNFKIKLLTPVNLFKNFKFRYETISSNFSQEGKFSTSGLCSKMILFCMLLLSTVVFSQAIGDYRSNVTTNPGSWTTVANWQRYNGTTWPTATVAQGYPGQYTSTANVTIVTGDIVELNASVQIASLTTVGTGQLRDSGVDGYTLKISGNIVLAAGLATPAAEVGPINMKIGTGGVNTIEMNGTAQQTISGTPANGPFFYNLDISNTSTAGVVLQTNVFVASNLNVASGSTYDLGTYTSNKNSSPAGNSTFTLAANAKLRLSGSTGGVSGSNFPNRAGGNTLTWSINSASTVEYYGTTQTVAMNYTNSSLTTADIDYGNLTISGTGTKTLGYDGLVAPTGVTVAGALTVNANNTLALSTYTLGSPTSTILYGGATTGSAITGTGQLTLGGNVTVNDATTGTSGATISCPVALGATRTFTVADDGTTATDLTISGVISGATFGVIKAGVGTMTLSGTNTYTGATTISAGTVKIGASSSVLGTTAGITSVTSGAVLDLNGFTLSTAEPLTLNGIGLASSPAGALTNTGGNASYSGAITLASASTITATSSGTLTSSGAVTGAYVLTLDGGTGSTGTMSGVISTPTSVIKNGAGTWILSGTNTYTGPTNITAGTLKIGASSSVLGTTAGITTVSSGAVLDINGFNLSTAEPLTLNGTGLTASPAGALTNTGGNASYSGAITLASASTITATTSGTLTCSGTVGTGAFGLTLDGATGSSGTMSGVISSPTSLTKNGAGTWTFSAANTYTGITTINAGVLQLGNNNVIAASPINLNGGTFRTGATTGYTDTVGTLTVSSASTIALGTGVHQINFATSSGVTWPSGNLTITGWTGVARASGTAGKVFVGAASGTLTAGQLAKIFFTGYTCSAMQLSTGEVVPSDNTVGAASSSPAACVSVAISPVVTHTTAGATGIANDGVSGANGLPAGVSATWATNTITISGTPTASGSFPYSILLTGGCGTVSATGTITVTALPVANAGADNCSIATGSFSITTGTPAGGTWIKVSGTGNISTGGNVTGFGNNSSAIFRYTVTNSCGSASDDVYYARGTNTVGTPTAITVIGTEPSCQLTNATTTTTYSTTATNSSSFNWSLSNPSAGSINSSGVMTWANGFSGTVNIQVTATSCSGTSSQVTRTVTISAAPAITVQPSTPAATCSGSGTQTMTVTATGAGLTYDWKLAGVSVVNGGVISGQGTVTLTLTNPTSANAGSYTVVVSGTCAPAVTSTARTVTVNALPSTPTLGTITQPTCVLSTGSVILSGLPGSGTINQTGTAAASYAITGTTMTISGLAVGSYTFSASNGTCSSLATGSVVISSAVTKTWNGTAWSPVGTPTKDNLVIINGNYSASSNGDLNACSLIINSGFKLTIESGKFVIIQNDLTVTGTLDVLDKGSLVMVNDAGVVTNTGTTNIRRFTTTFKLYDYTYWSTPVVSTTIATTFPTWNTSHAYEYLPANFFDGNADNIDDDNNDWSFVSAMTPAKGYIIMVPTPTTGPGTNNPFEVVFNGRVNNGVQKVTGVITGGTYLVGNPYPSALDADAFINANAGVIDGTLYFWTHNTAIQLASGIGAGKAGSGRYAYTSDDYASYNLVGGVGVATQAISGGTIPTGKIASCQSFFTTTNASIVGTNEIVFNNSMRLGSGGTTLSNAQFFKTKKPKGTIEKNRIWLNLSNDEGAFKQTLLGYVTGATNANEGLYDGESFDGNEFIDFYSVNQDKNLVIQGRALPFDENDEVPLGYTTTIDGTFSIDIEQVDGLLTSQNVFIEDKLTNSEFDLKSGKYTFNTEIGTFNDRFVLKYKSSNETLGSGDIDAQTNKVLVSVKNKQVKINSFAETIDNVVIYDVLGRLIYQKDNVNSNELSIADLAISNQALIVKTTLQNGIISTDKIIF